MQDTHSYDDSKNAVHLWLKNNFGKAKECEWCGRKRGLLFQWAKVRGKRYQKKRQNFWQLCVSCHANYDRRNSANFGGMIVAPNENPYYKDHGTYRYRQNYAKN